MRGLASDLGGIVRAGGVISRFDHGQGAASRGERAGRRWRAGGGGGPSGRAQWAAQGGGQGKWSGAGRAEQAGRAGQNRPRRRARRSGAEQAGRAAQAGSAKWSGAGRAGRAGRAARAGWAEWSGPAGRAGCDAGGWLGQVRSGSEAVTLRRRGRRRETVRWHFGHGWHIPHRAPLRLLVRSLWAAKPDLRKQGCTGLLAGQLGGN